MRPGVQLILHAFFLPLTSLPSCTTSKSNTCFSGKVRSVLECKPTNSNSTHHPPRQVFLNKHYNNNGNQKSRHDYSLEYSEDPTSVNLPSAL